MAPTERSLLCLASLLAVSTHAAGQERPRARVELSVPRASQGPLVDALRELAAEADVALDVGSVPRIELRSILATPPPVREGLLARVWLRVAPPEVLFVLSDARGERLLLRKLDVGEVLDPVDVESIAQILGSSLEALRLGGAIGVARAELVARVPALGAIDAVEARPPQVPDAPPAPPRRALGVLEVAEHVLVWSGKQPPQHRVALRGGLALDRPWRPGLLLEAGYLVPTTVRHADAGARLEGLAVRGGFELRPAFGRWSLRARLTVGLDLLRVEPRLFDASGLTVRPVQWTRLGMVETALGVGYRLHRRTSLFFGFGLDVDLADARYVVERSGAAETTFDPLRIRPFASLGLRVSFEQDGEDSTEP